MNNGRGGDLLLLLVRSSCHNQLLFAHLLLMLSGKEAVELMGPEEGHQHRLRGKVLTAGAGSCGRGRLQQLLRLYRRGSRLLLHQRRWLLLGPTPILTTVVVVAVVRRGDCSGGGCNIVSSSGVAAVAVSPRRALAAFLTKHFERFKTAVGPADL